MYKTKPCASPAEFWSHWSDGNAEVNRYILTQPRYGSQRSGQLFLIYVTEPFSKSLHVKVNAYDPQNTDHTIALKLNIVESWQTGIYDYRLMTSQFFDAATSLSPLKISFSSQEWCGITYEESHWTQDQLSIRGQSYFEGESIDQQFSNELRSSDQLLVYLRGLMSGGPQTIDNFSLSLLESARQRFLSHRPPTIYQGQIQKQAIRHQVTSLGTVKVQPFSYQRPNGVSCTVDVELALPHRIVAWACEDGEKALLESSMRTPYWRHTRPEDEHLLKSKNQ